MTIAEEKCKQYVVHETSKGLYVPEKIPRDRDNTVKTVLLGLGTVLYGVALFTSTAQNLIDNAAVTFQLMLCGCIPELCFYRLVLAYTEQKHIVSRYNSNYKLLLSDIWLSYMLPIFLLLISVNVLIVICYGENSWTILGQIGTISLIFQGFTMCIVFKILNLQDSPIYDSLKINCNDGLNYGAGMAYSFFYGYLKLVLKETGTEEKCLKELIQNYEDKEGVKFPILKLFILIPNSGFCHTNLKEFEGVEESSSLGEKLRTVAGVKDRVYKNSVYKIFDEKSKKRIYACVEYATPVHTFRQVCDHDGKHTAMYKKYKVDITLQFYLTLKQILEDNPDCGENCVLVYYDDKTVDGKNTNVAKIILTEIRRLRKKHE